jgi:hypothetical protein
VAATGGAATGAGTVAATSGKSENSSAYCWITRPYGWAGASLTCERGLPTGWSWPVEPQDVGRPQPPIRSSLRGIMSSCTGALREPGLPLLVERFNRGIRHQSDHRCIRVEKPEKTLAYRTAIFAMSPQNSRIRNACRRARGRQLVIETMVSPTPDGRVKAAGHPCEASANAPAAIASKATRPQGFGQTDATTRQRAPGAQNRLASDIFGDDDAVWKRAWGVESPYPGQDQRRPIERSRLCAERVLRRT